MRLARLVLDCYGCFQHQEIDLDPAPGRINLLVAPNGAGKSVLRAAFTDLLFDLSHQSPMTFAFPAARLRLTAEAILPDGGVRTLVRRKGRENTLADGTAAIPPGELRALLGGAGKELFQDLFALDTAGLREGGLALSRSNGRLGQMLLAGSGGFAHVQRLLGELTEARDEIGRVDHAHKARPLWRARLNLVEAEQRLQATALRPTAWLALEHTAAEAAQTLAALREESRAVAAELERRRAVRAARPWLANRDKAQAVLAETADAPRLEADIEPRWRRALAEHATAAAAAEQARQAVEAAVVEGEAPAHALSDAAERIEALSRDAVTALNAEAELAALEEEDRRAGLAAEGLRRDLGWPTGQDLPPAPAVRAARALLAKRTGVVEATTTAARELAAAEGRLTEARNALAGLPPVADQAALAALVREIRAGGEPALLLEAARRTCREAEAGLREALAALPGRTLTREALARTAAPAEPTVAAAEAALAEAEAACREAARDRAALARGEAEAAAALAALTREADLPAPGALAATRAARDALWDAALAGTAAAVLAYERALRAADAIADRLIAHAAQAAESETLRRRIAGMTATRPSLDEAAAAAAARLGAAQETLAALAEAAGAPADTQPAALRAFLAARLRALESALALDRAAATERDLAQALDDAARRLGALGISGEDLTARIAAAEARLAAARDAQQAHKAALAEVRTAERNAAARRDAAATRAQALDAWTAEWQAAVAALSRPADEPAEAAATALDLIEDLRRETDALAAAQARREALQAAIARCAAGAVALTATLAPDLAALPAQEAASRLQSALAAERAGAARHAAQVRARDTARASATRAAAKAKTASDALAALRTALGAADDAAAETRLDQARRVADARAELAEATRQIAALSGGLAETELAALAAAEPAEAEAARIAALENRQTELGEALEAAAAAARSAAEARDRAGDADAPQEAAAAREAARATLARHAEDALVLHAALSLLRAALDAGRDDADSRAVCRVGAVFQALTRGAYRGVAVEEDGADRVLVAIEADGLLAKRIEELSDGTADQLFLALRIAALEDYVRASPALPFIADDLLQTFDDARAEAALGALVELSRHVQVIVLTHHPHVAALARRLPADAVHALILAETP